MKVAILGAGCIGSVIAAQLARAGHEVTLVARGARKQQLAAEGLRVRSYGARTEQVHALPVVEALSEVQDAQVVFVTVQMQQVAAVLPALAQHSAQRICFMMNAHPVPPQWGQALGERLVLGFPAMLAGIRKGCVVYQTLPGWMRFAMISTLGPLRGGSTQPAEEMVALLREARLAATVHPDMESWLASHSALMTPLMAFAVRRIEAGSPLVMSAADSRAVARALGESLALVKPAGARLTPTNVALLRHVPTSTVASTLWGVSRLEVFQKAVYDYAEHARHEVEAMYAGLKHAAGEASSPALDRLCTELASEGSRSS